MRVCSTFYSQLSILRKFSWTAKKHSGVRSTHSLTILAQPGRHCFELHLAYIDPCHLVGGWDRCCQLIVLTVNEQVFSENSMLYGSGIVKITEMIVISDQNFLLQLIEFTKNILNMP